MKKSIWILNHYAGSMLFERGGRHYALAKYLKRSGYEPVIFCCNAMHTEQKCHLPDADALWQERTEESAGFPFVFVKARTYSGNGASRVLNMADFSRNVQKAGKQYATVHGKPDVILASSVHPLTLLAGEKLAKYFGVPCICEIRDLWPESIVQYSRFSRKNPVIRLLYRGERYLYKRANALVFTVEGAYDYILEHGWQNVISREKVFYINNGVDAEQFRENREQYRVEDADLEREDVVKIIYAGSIRKANDIDLLLDVAKRTADLPVRYLIWGDGDQRERLQKRLVDEHIDNLVFKGRVNKTFVPYITSRADINYLDVFQDDIARFGISPNKLFDYVAAEKPILMAFSGKYNPLRDYSSGLVCGVTTDSIAAKVREYFTLTEEQKTQMAEDSARAAKRFDYATHAAALAEILEQV